MVLGAVIITASCGGRDTLESFEGQSDVGPAGSGAGGASSSSSAGGSASVSSTSASSTGGGLLECEQDNNCSECANCSFEGSCNGVVSDCFSSPACSAFSDCLQPCSATEECFDQCIAMNPDGWELYQDLLVCVFCNACPNVCPEHTLDICAP